ncbi:MAG: hypothetical protein PHX93_02480 [Candidatus Peribacteraceae bacterium]|jgi:hypothetical protein|nr:hypothetical protein [Candidatus Peribacteraceae bacterium]
MAIFVEHLTAADLRDPTSQRGRLVEDVIERISEAEGVLQCAIRERIGRQLRQQGITYELLLSDHKIMHITQKQPAVPPSPFDEHFDEEIFLPTSKGSLGNPYEAKATPAMMVLLGMTRTPTATADACAAVPPQTPPSRRPQEAPGDTEQKSGVDSCGAQTLLLAPHADARCAAPVHRR